MRSLLLFLGCAGALLAGCGEPTAPEPGIETPDGAASEGVVSVAAGNTWSLRARMWSGRLKMPAATINGIIYVVGGQASTGLRTATLQAYNVATNTWSTRRSLPSPLSDRHNGASVINGRLYVTSGRTLLVYNPGTNTWTRKADVPAETGYGAQGVIGGRLYVYSAYLGNKFWRYDPATNTWTKRAAPFTHAFPVAGVIGGKFYLAGGKDELDLGVEGLQLYDPGTNTWTSRADMPLRLSDMASAVINGKLYVAGGIESPLEPPFFDRIVANLLVYDPAVNKWTIRPSMPTARAHAAGAAASGKFFVMGGWSGTSVLRKVEAYTP